MGVQYGGLNLQLPKQAVDNTTHTAVYFSGHYKLFAHSFTRWKFQRVFPKAQVAGTNCTSRIHLPLDGVLGGKLL